MKLHRSLLITHGAVAAIGFVVATTLVLLGQPTWTLIIAAAVSTVAGFIGSAYIVNRVQHGLREIERVAAKPNSGDCESFDELNRCGDRVAEQAKKWRDAATGGLEQIRECESLLRQLDRRAGRANGPVGLQLRETLRGLAADLAEQLTAVTQLGQEIQQCSRGLVDGNEGQGETIGKATASVERISDNIDSVAELADTTQRGAEQLQQLVANAATAVDQSIRQLGELDQVADGCERKVRNLEDHGAKVLSLVETLGALAARTDLLALNASIESVRAGEHGRGFAIVAEEIRELAERSSQATHEVAGLVNAMQTESRDTITLLDRERQAISQSDQQATATLTTLNEAQQATQNWSGRAEEIAVVSRQQLHLAQDIVVAVERLSQAAKSGRSLAERAQWNTDSLDKAVAQLRDALAPLRGEQSRSASQVARHEKPEESARLPDEEAADRATEDALTTMV